MCYHAEGFALQCFHFVCFKHGLPQTLHDWMLAMMVVCFVVIDLIMLVVFSAVEGSRGKLGADRVLDKENEATEEGVRSSYLC